MVVVVVSSAFSVSVRCKFRHTVYNNHSSYFSHSLHFASSVGISVEVDALTGLWDVCTDLIARTENANFMQYVLWNLDGLTRCTVHSLPGLWFTFWVQYSTVYDLVILRCSAVHAPRHCGEVNHANFSCRSWCILLLFAFSAAKVKFFYNLSYSQ